MGNLLIVLALLVAPGDDPEARPSPSQRYQALRREHEALMTAHRESAKNAKTPEERSARDDLFQSRLTNLSERAFQLARMNPKEDVAVDALAWIVRNQRVGRAPVRALETLTAEHVESSRLAEACRDAGHAAPSTFEAAEAFLRAAMDHSPHREVRGIAGYNLATRLRERSELVRQMEQNLEEVEHMQSIFNFSTRSLARFRSRSADDLLAESETLYETLVTSYDDIPSRAKGATIGKLAEARLFQIRNLDVGSIVPEIAANDFAGKPLSLSEHRGKVVVLVFSGTWSPPSRKLYPLQRALVKRLENEPFALLSFNAERDPANLKKAMDAGEITWRCWREEGPSSPTLLRWGIDRYPTIFVIDAEGKIRYRDPQEDRLDVLVDGLLQEAEKKKTPKE